jgi:hypothetical protein
MDTPFPIRPDSSSRSVAIYRIMRAVDRELDFMRFRAKESDDDTIAWLIEREVTPHIPHHILYEYRLNVIFGLLDREDAERGLGTWMRNQPCSNSQPHDALVHRSEWVGSHITFTFYTGYRYRVSMTDVVRLLFRHVTALSRHDSLALLARLLREQQARTRAVRSTPRDANAMLRAIVDGIVLTHAAIHFTGAHE